MDVSGIWPFVKQRLAARKDSEHGQALVRVALVSIVFVYFFTDYFASRVDAEALASARWLVSISITLSLLIFAAIVWKPAKSVTRRLIGMLHDVAGISLSMYFGEGAGAAVSVIYLWITVGNGFRYGVHYLYGCAFLSLSGFGLVYVVSEFWQQQPLLSLNILLVMLVVPPYVASLLRSLHAARDALQHQASTDKLTGLLSRREMEDAVEGLFHGDANGHVLLYCDLDRFKEVNDIAGHAAGDKLLADLAEIIKKSVRSDDLSGRMGGDEFCVLLRNCRPERGRKIAEKIRSKVTGYRLAWGTEYFSVGMSIGVAPSDAVNDAESLFRLADAACYAAKNAGRNRVHIVDPGLDLVDTQEIRRLFGDSANDSGTNGRTIGRALSD